MLEPSQGQSCGQINGRVESFEDVNNNGSSDGGAGRPSEDKVGENLGSVLRFLHKDVYKSGVAARVPRVRRLRENCPRLAWGTEEKLQLKYLIKGSISVHASTIYNPRLTFLYSHRARKIICTITDCILKKKDKVLL